MGVIRKSIKYGVPSGILFIGGVKIGFKIAKVAKRYQQDEEEDYNLEEETSDMWTGPTRTLTFDKESARDIVETIEEYENSQEIKDDMVEKTKNPFLFNDLREIKTNIQHELSELTPVDSEVEISIHDRQRLALFDWVYLKDYTIEDIPNEGE